MHLAACGGHLEIVKWHLEVGAKLDPRDRHGNTSLDDALRSECTEVADLLQTTTLDMKEEQ